MLKTCIILTITLLIFTGCKMTTPEKPPIPTGQFEINHEPAFKYLLFLPENYNEKNTGRDKDRLPLMMFLHGAGERGDNLNALKMHGPPKIVETDKMFPFIVVSPQCPEGQWWGAGDSIEKLNALLDNIIANYNVDPDRVYLTGLSMGGFGTWHLACAFPEKFAAIVPICGGGDVKLAHKITHLPIRVFHGGKDNVVKPEQSTNMVNAVNAAGGHAKLTLYPEAHHNSWTQTYDNPELYQWLLKQHR